MRRRLGGRQPLCGTGVMSEMLEILIPSAFRARTEHSRPGPGPFTRTSRVLIPYSWAARPAASAATWAATGVDLREPLTHDGNTGVEGRSGSVLVVYGDRRKIKKTK